MPDSDKRSPLTIEDLLHLKRAERPSPEFWTRFETELRQKQLAALIDRRPWWQTIPQLLGQRRAILPIGATAIIALTLASVKFHSPAPVNSVASLNTASVVAPASTPLVSVPVLEPTRSAVATGAAVETVVAGNAAVVADVSLSANLPEHASELTPWSASRPAQISSAKLFVSTIEQPERIETGLVKTLVNNFSAPAAKRVQRSGGAVAELASVSAQASKRTRLLAQFSDRQFTPEPQAPALVRERLTRRLADATNGSDHFTRVGLKGDQVSLRF